MTVSPDGENERLREELRVTQDRLNHLLEGGPVSLFAQDLDLRLTWVQNAMSRRDPELLIGQTDGEFLEDPDELAFARQIKQEVMRSGLPARVVAPRTIAGEKRYFDLLLKPTRNPQGDIDGIAGVSYEVTDRRRAELALHETDRRKDEFVALLAHELRGPLAPMRNLLAVLLSDEGQVDVKALARALDRQVGFMTRLIDDLLDISRITNDKMVLRRRRFDLGALIRRICDPMRYRSLSEHSPIIHYEIPESPVIVFADLVRIGQVLGNILENARKFTPSEGDVRIRLQTRGADVVLTVSDTGRGIDPANLETIFERFRQGHQRDDPSNDGLGLGLYLARRLIVMHGGSLEASSEGPQRGSTFTIVLPQAIVAEAPGSEVPEPRVSDSPVPDSSVSESPVSDSHAAFNDLKGAPVARDAMTEQSMSPSRRILVVDDHTDTAQSMSMLIESWGHQVRVANNGRAGLELVKAWQPELVFLDVRMPVMDGLEMTRRIRAEPALRQPRLVALTGFGQREDLDRSLQAGVDTHLIKPADPAQVRAIIEQDQRL